ncbi:MAG TPA: hypothetical protein VK764_02900 [Terracidiphilus sp.]|nr:hypothetical protein [Terracidiphilus sp.]
MNLQNKTQKAESVTALQDLDTRYKALQHRVVSLPLLALPVFLLFLASPACHAVEPSPVALAGFNAYVTLVENRLDEQHRSPATFLATPALSPQNRARLRNREFVVERLTPSTAPNMPGAMLHHWRATGFAPGAKAADFERLMKDFNAYPQHFAPQVLQARILAGQEDHVQALIRVRQHHVLTVVLDTTYDVTFARLDPQHGSSISRSTRVSEIASPDTASEHTLAPSDAHGFLWRLNTYWSYEEQDGGLYLQVESVSLTRSIPTGLGWAIGPFVESVPRESMEFTLRSTCNALRR